MSAGGFGTDNGEPLRLTAWEIDPARQRVEVSYVYGTASGTIVIDGTTLEWRDHG